MESISALGGQHVNVPAVTDIVQQTLARPFGSSVPTPSLLGSVFHFAGVREGSLNLPVQMNWFMRVADVSKRPEEPSMSSLGTRMSSVTHVPPRVEEQAIPQLGVLAVSASGDDAVIQTRERVEVSTDRLPYASLIRGMLDRDQVTSARTLLNVALVDQPNDGTLRTAAGILALPTSARKPLRDRDRTLEYAWLTRHYAEHRGEWVALVGNELVATAPSLKDLLTTLERSGRRGDSLIHRVA